MSACWQCQAEVGPGALLCEACGGLQPPQRGRSHFEVLGLPERYAQDAADVERRFKALSRRVHPDRFATEGPTARRLALEHATALNDAYRVLKDDAQRARYLLERWGRPITERSGYNVALPMAFLEEVMEVRERLMDADAPARERELAGVRARLDDLDAATARAFDAYDRAEAPERPGLLEGLERLIHQQRYLRSILNEHAA